MSLERLKELTAGRPVRVTEEASDEQKVRKFFRAAEKAVDQLNSLVHGNELKVLVKSGGLPETESKEMRDTFDKFHDAFLDLQMSLMMDFQHPDEPGYGLRDGEDPDVEPKGYGSHDRK